MILYIIRLLLFILNISFGAIFKVSDKSYKVNSFTILKALLNSHLAYLRETSYRPQNKYLKISTSRLSSTSKLSNISRLLSILQPLGKLRMLSTSKTLSKLWLAYIFQLSIAYIATVKLLRNKY